MFKIISQADAKKLMASESNIFDVRDQTAFDEMHIPNAKFLSGENFEEVTESCDKNLPTIVYCYKGIRSQTIAKVLSETGFTNVFSLEGGFGAWQA